MIELFVKVECEKHVRVLSTFSGALVHCSTLKSRNEERITQSDINFHVLFQPNLL